MLDFHMVFNCVIAAEATSSHVLISLVEFPSLHIMDPRYLNVSTSSNLCPFIMILVGV
jgi:hypothetical protein